MTVLQLVLLRHGESEANIAAEEAERTRAVRVAVPARDPDVVLSATGREQAQAVGPALARMAERERPTAVWVSPYRRAQQTAELALESSGLDLPIRVDERLRDRELGVLDTLTSHGVDQLHPEEAARRRFLGKFYYRPPGGEAWTDVALRVRSLLRDLDDASDERVLVVCHDAVIMLFRGICERIAERELLDEARAHPVPNCSLTRLVRDAPGEPWRAVTVNDIRHLESEDVTLHAGDPRGTKP
jgi:broad specificity phosphatase PhoE